MPKRINTDNLYDVTKSFNYLVSLSLSLPLREPTYLTLPTSPKYCTILLKNSLILILILILNPESWLNTALSISISNINIKYLQVHACCACVHLVCEIFWFDWVYEDYKEAVFMTWMMRRRRRIRMRMRMRRRMKRMIV